MKPRIYLLALGAMMVIVAVERYRAWRVRQPESRETSRP